MRPSQTMRKLLSSLKQLGGFWASPASAVLPGLAFITETFHGKRERFVEDAEVGSVAKKIILEFKFIQK